MDPITLSLIAAGGQALLPAIQAIGQKRKLKDLPDIERPDFQIPEAAIEQLGIARSIASNRNMPGYNEALDKIENQTNRAIGDVKAAGGNMQDIMAAMASANVGAAMAKRDLDITNDRSYLGSLQNLQTQLGQYAAQENLKQQDEMKKYTDEMARRAALDTARQQNIQNAVGSVAQGVASVAGNRMNMNMMEKQFNNQMALQDAGFDKMLASTAMQNMPTTNDQVKSYNAAAATVGAPMQSLMLSAPLTMPDAGVGIVPQLNPASVNAQNPSGAPVMASNPYGGVTLSPMSNVGTTTTAVGVTRPDLLPQNRAASLDMSAQPGYGPLLPGLDPNVIAANGGAGVLAPQFAIGQPYDSGVLYNNPAQATSTVPQQQGQTAFSMLSPQEQQKKILELMTISGVNR